MCGTFNTFIIKITKKNKKNSKLKKVNFGICLKTFFYFSKKNCATTVFIKPVNS